MTLITSRSNPKIRQVRQLRQRKHRQESGLFVVEGIHPVGQAVEAASSGQNGLTLDSIIYAPDLLTSDYALQLIEQQAQSGLPCYPTSPQVFATITEKEHPQGILAVAHLPQQSITDLSPSNFPWGVALVSPQDPGNIGAILRTIDAVSASGLLLLDESADPSHPNSVRASMGAIFWYPIVLTPFADFAVWCKSYSYHVYGTSAHGSLDYKEIDRYEYPAILLMGSEQKGLTPEQMDLCELVIRLPMKGRVSSLNLAVAAGILLYQMLHN